MRITTLQWNIGGGKIRSVDADPGVMASYVQAGIASILKTIRAYSPDVVTLQEVHADDTLDQAAFIAQSLGMHVVTDAYAQSHIEEGQQLCQSVLSRFQMRDHRFSLFTNPGLRTLGEDGKEWYAHDKGMSSCTLDVAPGVSLVVQTLHSVPLRKFGVEPDAPSIQAYRASMDNSIESRVSPCLLQGDFNTADVYAFLPSLAHAGFVEAGGGEPTTPRNRLYDHIFFRALQPISVHVDSSALTDHYPVIASFEL